ncbi:MAG TPA: HAD family hydrolase [Candidatus Cybelea sp.]|jgi:HAD superfamily hydrolase (TIGR01509 family)|nr:HAD family hydrolase [Candidatus Cybelea sp.]
MSTVLGIGFDLDHTLAIDNRLERVAFLRVLELVLGEGGRTIGTLGDEIDGIDDLLVRQRSGAFTIDDAVRRFVAERGVEPADRYAEFFRRTAVDMVDDFLVPLPGVRPTLDALCERGIAVAMLSNGWNPLQRRKAERAGFRGPMLVSTEIGQRKPAPQAFELLLHALGTSPEQSWYVGDDPQGDVAGAQAVGMQGIWINWERKSYPAHLPPPGYTIAGFSELLALLPSPARVT